MIWLRMVVMKMLHFMRLLFIGRRFEGDIKVDPSTYVAYSSVLEIVQGGKITVAGKCDILDGCMIRTYGGEISIGQRCSIHPYCVFYGNGGVKLGNGVLMGPHVVIVANNHTFEDPTRYIWEQAMESRGVTIGDDVWIGAGARILDGVNVGRGSVIAAGAVVTRSVPEYTVVAGVPARVMRRRGPITESNSGVSESDGESVHHSFFDDIYHKDADPWDYTCGHYEKRKYRTTLKCLPKERFHNALEIGCAIGVLTSMLAKRCDKLLAIDYSEEGLREARERCNKLPRVRFERMQIPREFPADKYDLILFSEVGYYLNMKDLRVAQRRMFELLMPGGYLMMVHYRFKLDSFILDGDTVHDLFIREGLPGLKHLGDPRKRSAFILDILFRYFKKYRVDLFQRVNDSE